MNSGTGKSIGVATILVSILSFGAGAFFGSQDNTVYAAMQPPTEHKGISLTPLGVVPESTLAATIGLNGYIMQLREITLQPGGQIARHSHATRPGLVLTLSGSWTEGRASGERDYPAGEKIALVEDEATDHWFFNRESEPVTVVVCDIVPPS
jgi:quercetin dioxygenase-like cupin family protein